jgi:chemotaxis protein MotB
MKRTRLFATAGLGIVALLASGCTQGLEDQVQSLQEQNQSLRAERNSLRDQLQTCLVNNSDCEDRLLDLQMKYSQALDELENRPTGTDLPPGWGGTEAYAWLDVGDDVLFDSGSDALKSSGKQKVAEVARTVQREFPDSKLWVVGHTDSDPIRVTKDKYKDNLDLSLNRAAAVYRELMSLGLDPQIMSAAGQGEYNPIAPNDSDEGKAQNRRVTFLAVKAPDIVQR